jgi:hypothetical protein
MEMRANEAFPSTYLKSSDVKDRPIIATISHIEQVSVGQGKEAKDKFALFFESGKPMVLQPLELAFLSSSIFFSSLSSSKSIVQGQSCHRNRLINLFGYFCMYFQATG